MVVCSMYRLPAGAEALAETVEFFRKHAKANVRVPGVGAFAWPVEPRAPESP